MDSQVKEIKMVCRTVPDGQKLVAATVEYDRPIDPDSLTIHSYNVEGRNVWAVHPSRSNPCKVVIKLNPEDEGADLVYFENPGPNAEWKRRKAKLTIRQAEEIRTGDGDVIPAWPEPAAGQEEEEPIVDRFTQHTFRSERTGQELSYNLFLPAGYNESGSYPLVMFIHDRGPLSADPKTTLRQGIGAVCWAEESFQEIHPCIVLAPQYQAVPMTEQGGDGSGGKLDMIETTFDLYEHIIESYAVDKKRLYATGQSMGCMSSIVMGIRRPGFFTAFYLVAGQWEPQAMTALKDENMLIVVSRGDPRAFSGMNESLLALDDSGAEIQFGMLEQKKGKVSETDMEELLSRPGNIHYGVLKTKERGFQCHMGTWEVAYGIAAAKEWLFAQEKEA